jgi:hypothetical protein
MLAGRCPRRCRGGVGKPLARCWNRACGLLRVRLRRACLRAGEDDRILAFGSFLTVAAALQVLGRSA